MYQSHDSSRTVAYFYNYQIGKFHYGKEHPMKPKRIAMAHNLIVNYGLYRNLDVYQSREASFKELRRFHDNDYLKYLSRFISTQKMNIIREYQCAGVIDKSEWQTLGEGVKEEADLVPGSQQMVGMTSNFRVGDSQDCPSFPGLFTFCQLSTGASIDSAHAIMVNEAQLAINWSGGLHHAKKREASGFCYVNDIVICILELLRMYNRVLYVDIDVHHGDGVEEAFYLTNRVMTLSFHQYGNDFYPGSGGIESIGEGPGKYYSINVPMKPGMTDETYFLLFKRVLDRVMQAYRPDAIVMQCGADSLSYDKLGGFNLSIK